MKKLFLSFVTCLCMWTALFILTPVMITYAEGVSVTENVTASVLWADGTTIDRAITITGGTTEQPIVVDVRGKVVVNQEITVNGFVHFTGEGTLIRGHEFAGHLISVTGGELTLGAITLDGGAVWNQGPVNEVLGRAMDTTSPVTHNSIVYVVNEGTVLNVNKGAVIQNNNGAALPNQNHEYDRAGSDTGGIYGEKHCTVNMTYGSKVCNNRCNSGAGIRLEQATLNMSDGEVYGNDSIVGGGAGICVGGGTITVTGGSIHNNLIEANGHGAGIYAATTKGTIGGANIYHNSSSGEGGALYLYKSSTITLKDKLLIENNTAAITGGGIFFDASTVLMVDGCVAVQSNTAGGYPNNVYLDPGQYLLIPTAEYNGNIGVTIGKNQPNPDKIEIAQNLAGDRVTSISGQEKRFLPDDSAQGYTVIYQSEDNKIYLVHKPVEDDKCHISLVRSEGIIGFRYSIDGGTTWFDCPESFYIKRTEIPYTIQIQALLDTGYTFEKWEVGNTSNPLRLTSKELRQDQTYYPTAIAQKAIAPVPSVVVKDDVIKGVIIATAKQKSSTKTVLTWTKVDGADGYMIYSNFCNSKGNVCYVKLTKILLGNSTFRYTMTNMQKNRFYKATVVAFKMVNSKEVILAKSPVVHFINSVKKYKEANPVKIRVSSSQVMLQAGKSTKVRGFVTIPAGKREGRDHAASIRYLSSNKKIATVTADGRIKGKKAGSCFVYVYSLNGLYKKVNISVK